MNTELLPCPFCGGKAHKTYVSDFRISSPRTGSRVTCGQCPAQSGAFGNEDEAIAAWNRRATQPQAPQGGVTPWIPEEVVRLMALVDDYGEERYQTGWDERVDEVETGQVHDEAAIHLRIKIEHDLHVALLRAAPETPEGQKP